MILFGVLLGAAVTWSWITYRQNGGSALVEHRASQVSVKTLRAGAGGRPKADDVVLVNYSMGIEGNTTVLDSGQQAAMPLGQVVPGFRDAVVQMQKGGKFRAQVPASLAYGDRGSGPIPANSDLWFVVELLDFMPQAQFEAALRSQQAGGAATPAAPTGNDVRRN